MALIAITQQGGNTFSINEENIIILYTNGSKNIVEHINSDNGLKKVTEITEAIADIYAKTGNMITTVIGGNTVYINKNKITLVAEKDSKAIIHLDEGTESPAQYVSDSDMATFLTAATTSKKNYKVYRATLTQSGTNPPVAVVVENTLGGTPSWSRFQAGSYYMTLAGAFTENKTIITHNNTGTDAASNVMCYWEDANTIYYEVTDGTSYADNRFYNNHSIEIKVYE